MELSPEQDLLDTSGADNNTWTRAGVADALTLVYGRRVAEQLVREFSAFLAEKIPGRPRETRT